MISEEKIQELVNEELEEAKKKHGEYLNSSHEKYAVLLEEFEEAQKEFDEMLVTMRYLWICIKKDSDNKATANISNLKQRTIHCIQELIQVVAMCDKEVKKC